jgi:hypothetical protein
MAVAEKQLAQETPTSATSLYSPAVNTTTTIRSIVVCNHGNNDTTFSIYLDDDGSTYDTDTALFYKCAIDAKSTVLINGIEWTMNDYNGNLAGDSGNGNCTFTIFGKEEN